MFRQSLPAPGGAGEVVPMASRTLLFLLPAVSCLLPALAAAAPRRPLPPAVRYAERLELPALPAGPAVGATAAPAVHGLEERLLGLVNAERSRRGLAVLSPDPDLAAAARMHCRDMEARGYFSHFAPAGARSPTDRYRAAAGGRARNAAIGENIFRAGGPGCADVHRAHAAFMDSAGHRENVLRPQWRRAGIAVHVSGGTAWVTQVFSD